jgi:hypothetical protein
MKQDIVLPKFNLPGNRSSWVVRGLWIGGGLVALQMVLVVVALWRHQTTVQTQLVLEQQRLAAAAADRPVKAAVPTAAPVAAVAVAPAAQPAVAAAAPATNEEKTAGQRAGRARKGSQRANKLLARAGASRSSGSRVAGKAPASGGHSNDAIDELLRKFK